MIRQTPASGRTADCGTNGAAFLACRLFGAAARPRVVADAGCRGRLRLRGGLDAPLSERFNAICDQAPQMSAMPGNPAAGGAGGDGGPLQTAEHVVAPADVAAARRARCKRGALALLPQGPRTGAAAWAKRSPALSAYRGRSPGPCRSRGQAWELAGRQRARADALRQQRWNQAAAASLHCRSAGAGASIEQTRGSDVSEFLRRDPGR